MNNYRDNLAKFRELDAQVLGISVDAPPSLKVFAEQTGVQFPLLSDFKRQAAAAYGILNEERGFAERATFVIDRDGKIRAIETGAAAIDPAGALASCRAIR